MYTIEQVHVLRIALAITAEAMKRNNERKWLGIVMTTGHSQLCVSSFITHRHVCMLISVVCWPKTFIRARKMTFSPKAIVGWYV